MVRKKSAKGATHTSWGKSAKGKGEAYTLGARAPKARPILAWGEAQVTGPEKTLRGLKARSITFPNGPSLAITALYRRIALVRQ
jgi:hypothetical protein